MFKIKRLAIFFLSLVLLATAGCQIRPLYGSNTNSIGGESIATALRSVEIGSPSNRTDQLVRNELVFRLYGGELDATNPVYKLSISTTSSESTSSAAVSANYTLKNISTSEVILTQSTSATAYFREVTQDFANSRSIIDAKKRAAVIVAGTIRNKVALALSQ